MLFEWEMCYFGVWGGLSGGELRGGKLGGKEFGVMEGLGLGWGWGIMVGRM